MICFFIFFVDLLPFFFSWKTSRFFVDSSRFSSFFENLSLFLGIAASFFLPFFFIVYFVFHHAASESTWYWIRFLCASEWRTEFHSCYSTFGWFHDSSFWREKQIEVCWWIHGNSRWRWFESQCLESCNHLIQSWIINSVTHQIAQTLVFHENAIDAWLDLKEHFSKVDRIRIDTLRSKFNNLKQGSKSILDYFTKMKTHWKSWIHTVQCHIALVLIPVVVQLWEKHIITWRSSYPVSNWFKWSIQCY